MKKLSYEKAKALCNTIRKKYSKERKLGEFCEAHDINYRNLSAALHEDAEKMYPKLLQKVLEAEGNTVAIKKRIIYEFEVGD